MFFTDKERMKAWKETSDIVKTYTDGLVEQWNKDIDTLLVYVRTSCDTARYLD